MKKKALILIGLVLFFEVTMSSKGQYLEVAHIETKVVARKRLEKKDNQIMIMPSFFHSLSMD